MATLFRPPALADKVAFLSDPANYAEDPKGVRAIETHHSWVFLTDHYAYKLKKPSLFDHHDLRPVDARAAHCRREVTLNRRLTDGVYLRVVPLAADDEGALTLGGPGAAVDWLVQMRRLPEDLGLDRLIRNDRVPIERLHDAIHLLSRHYRMTRPEPLGGEQWRDRLESLVKSNRHALGEWRGAIDVEEMRDTCARQLVFIAGSEALLDARVAAGRIVEGHGDLRPEHVFLEPRPQIIDSLDFSHRLRVVDVAEELGFLAMECEHLGAPWLREEIFAAHATLSGDRPSPRLVDFYQSVQACVRAKLSVWHLRDHPVRDFDGWAGRSREYLALARAHMDAAA